MVMTPLVWNAPVSVVSGRELPPLECVKGGMMTSFQGWTPPGVASPLARRSGVWSSMLDDIIAQVSGENHTASYRFEGRCRDVSGERAAVEGASRT